MRRNKYLSPDVAFQEEVRTLYCDKGFTITEIAKQLHTSFSTVKRAMDKIDLMRRPRWASGKHLERMGYPRTQESQADDWTGGWNEDWDNWEDDWDD